MWFCGCGGVFVCFWFFKSNWPNAEQHCTCICKDKSSLESHTEITRILQKLINLLMDPDTRLNSGSTQMYTSVKAVQDAKCTFANT